MRHCSVLVAAPSLDPLLSPLSPLPPLSELAALDDAACISMPLMHTPQSLAVDLAQKAAIALLAPPRLQRGEAGGTANGGQWAGRAKASATWSASVASHVCRICRISSLPLHCLLAGLTELSAAGMLARAWPLLLARGEWAARGGEKEIGRRRRGPHARGSLLHRSRAPVRIGGPLSRRSRGEISESRSARPGGGGHSGAWGRVSRRSDVPAASAGRAAGSGWPHSSHSSLLVCTPLAAPRLLPLAAAKRIDSHCNPTLRPSMHAHCRCCSLALSLSLTLINSSPAQSASRSSPVAWPSIAGTLSVSSFLFFSPYLSILLPSSKKYTPWRGRAVGAMRCRRSEGDAMRRAHAHC